MSERGSSVYVVVETAEAVLPEGDVVQTEAGTDVVNLYGSNSGGGGSCSGGNNSVSGGGSSNNYSSCCSNNNNRSC